MPKLLAEITILEPQDESQPGTHRQNRRKEALRHPRSFQNAVTTTTELYRRPLWELYRWPTSRNRKHNNHRNHRNYRNHRNHRNYRNHRNHRNCRNHRNYRNYRNQKGPASNRNTSTLQNQKNPLPRLTYLVPFLLPRMEGAFVPCGDPRKRGTNKRNATWRPVPKVKKLQEHDHKRNLDIYSLLTVIWHHSRNDLAAIATQPS